MICCSVKVMLKVNYRTCFTRTCKQCITKKSCFNVQISQRKKIITDPDRIEVGFIVKLWKLNNRVHHFKKQRKKLHDDKLKLVMYPELTSSVKSEVFDDRRRFLEREVDIRAIERVSDSDW